jgi:hypothetical protein
MWAGNNRPAEDIYFIDFKNIPFLFDREDSYGVGFYGNESNKGTKNYRINITLYPEENYIVFSSFSEAGDNTLHTGWRSNWSVGARFYFEDSQITKDRMDDFVNAVKALREHQRSGVLYNFIQDRIN